MMPHAKPSLSVIIPAHNEAQWISACLGSILASEGPLPVREIIVIANGCRDDTADRARALISTAGEWGWNLNVIETGTPGKLNALTLGDHTARGSKRIYVDADVTISPGLIAALVEALGSSAPRYATGTPRLSQAASGVSRAYARFWAKLPFVSTGTPGFGLFAVNAAGRARWGDWPDIIADDMFARLSFAPSERVCVKDTYDWPPVEGFANLICVRRRQNAGVRQLAQQFPMLMQNEDTVRPGLPKTLGLAVRDPLGFGVYAAVALGVRSHMTGDQTVWARGR